MDINCKLICEICCAIFSRKSNLSRHTKNVHFPEKKFMCEHCSKSYNTNCSLIRHITSNHLNEPKKKPKVYWQCPICIFKSDKILMVTHYQKVHNLDTNPEKITFTSFDEFENWKRNLENETYSKYIRHRNRKHSRKLKYFYRCHRDGFYKSRGNNIRSLKKIGSNKINAHCPAKIAVVINDTGTVYAHFVKSHIGHEMESIRLSLTESGKKNLTNTIADPHENGNLESNTNVKTNSFTTTKEINIMKQNLMDKFQLILNSTESVKDCEMITKNLSDLEKVLQNNVK